MKKGEIITSPIKVWVAVNIQKGRNLMMYYEPQIDLFCCTIDDSLEDCKTTDVSDLFPFDELTVLLDRSENGSISSIEIFPASLVFRQEFL